MTDQPGQDEQPDPAELPDLEAILRDIHGISPDMGDALRAMAQLHADWRQAWTDTGQFSAEEAFELVRLLVVTSAGGLRALD